MFIKFEIFCKPAYEIAFSPIDDIEKDLQEAPKNFLLKDRFNIIAEEIIKRNTIKKFIVLDGMAAIRDYGIEIEEEDNIEETPVIDKKIVRNLNQFSIFKGIIDFI